MLVLRIQISRDDAALENVTPLPIHYNGLEFHTLTKQLTAGILGALMTLESRNLSKIVKNDSEALKDPQKV